MRIITWNCAGKFREKFDHILTLNSDILIVQECEKDTCIKVNEKYKMKSLWFGDKVHYKGLGIFYKTDCEINLYNYFSFNYKLIIPLVVDLKKIKFHLMPVWTFSEEKRSYNIQLEEAIPFYTDYLKVSEVLVIGDYNAPYRKGAKPNYIGKIDTQLKALNLQSIYHVFNNVEIGEHIESTFYHQRNIEFPHMLDYAYGSKYFQDNISNVSVGNYADWIDKSDHMPLILDFNI
jgi:exonuclease III